MEPAETVQEPFFQETDIEAPTETPQVEPEGELEAAPVQPQEDSPPEDPEEAYRYWQSKHDKLQSERDELAKKAEQVEQYGPLYDYASQYEQEFLDFVEQKLQGGQTAGTQGDGAFGQPPASHLQDSPGTQQEDPFSVLEEPMPERPKRPEDRDDWKAMEAYESKRDAYDEAMDRRLRAQSEITRMQREQQMQTEAQRQAMTQAVSYVQKLGAQPDEAQAFLRDYLNPQKRAELDKQVLAAWRASNGKTEQPPEPKKPPVDPARLEQLQKGRADGPAPAATVPGKAETRVDSLFQQKEVPTSIW